MVRKRYVLLDAQRAVASETIDLNLFPDKRFLAQVVRTETMGPRGRVWIGRIAGQEGRVVLVAVDNVLVGDVRMSRELFEIRYAGEGIHVTYELDPSMYSPEEPPDWDGGMPEAPAHAENTGGGDSTIATDPCDLVDVLVVYTPAVRDASGGVQSVEALAYLSIANTNIAFENSDVNVRLNPVHIAQTNYTEVNLPTDVTRLRNTGDGFMDEVHGLRDTYCADLTLLLATVANGKCGRAFEIQDPAPDPGMATDAFAVVNYTCAAGNLSFAHEAAHLFGCRHDWFVDGETTPYTHAHGYVDSHWRTVMAYPQDCSFCPRQPLFSNPNVTFMGAPAGIPSGTSSSCTTGNANPQCDAENWRVLNDTSCTVANFRDRSQCAEGGDVWMKDSWSDTGAEPDPLTAGQRMYRSPYIWVRTEEDAPRLRQHEHENPIFGQTNYVYAKLHNDFSVGASGQLKVYYADAATGLRWPTDWTLISDTLVSIDANDTVIAETIWDPPGPGHFCLLARWTEPNTPSDPMTSPEGPDMDPNVRNNNNIVWRNVNVVAMASEEADHAAPPVIVRNTQNEAQSIDLRVHLANTPNNLIRRGGRVVLDLGVLYDLWKSAGGAGSGIQEIGGTLVEVLDTPEARSEINDIPMGASQAEKVHLIFTAPKVAYTPQSGVGDDPIEFCSPGGLPIPDEDPNGVTDSLLVGDCLEINDLSLSIKTAHTWVGDLSYKLTHVVTGKTVVPLDRPGVPTSTFGCDGDDIDTMLDDHVTDPVEDTCAAAVPTIQGTFVPGDPPDQKMFETFRGDEVCGEWKLTVVDHEAGFAGTLGEWCLLLGDDPVPEGPVTHYEVDLVQADAAGDEVGGVGYDIEVTPAGGAGAVPDSGSRPGTPLILAKEPDGSLRLSWGATCLNPTAVDMDYTVNEGAMGDFTSHVPVLCSTGGVTEAIVTPRADSAYYLIAPRNEHFVGSLGLTSDLTERSPGPAACVPQDVATCP